MITVVINAAPKDYKSILATEQVNTLADLRLSMNQYWCAIKGGTNKPDDEGNELVLSSFGGYCFTCKKKGHKAHNAPTKGNQVKVRAIKVEKGDISMENAIIVVMRELEINKHIQNQSGRASKPSSGSRWNPWSGIVTL